MRWYKHCPRKLQPSNSLRPGDTCISELRHHCFRQWFSTKQVSSHSSIQWWIIVDWTFINTLQWNNHQNTRKCVWKYHLQNYGNCGQVSMCQTTLSQEMEHETFTVTVTFCLNNNGMGYTWMSLILGEHLYFDSVKKYDLWQRHFTARIKGRYCLPHCIVN